jgi:hypothetical protein
MTAYSKRRDLMNGKDDFTVTFTPEEIKKIKEAIDIIIERIQAQIPAQCSWDNPRKRPTLGE